MQTFACKILKKITRIVMFLKICKTRLKEESVFGCIVCLAFYTSFYIRIPKVKFCVCVFQELCILFFKLITIKIG